MKHSLLGPMRRNTAMAGALLGLMLSGPAAAVERPWYVEAKIGQAEADAEFGRVHRKIFDDESNGASIEIGYTISRFLGVQAGFHDAGEYRGTGAPCPDADEICVATVAEEQLALGLCVEGTVCPLVAVQLDAEVESWSLAAVPRWPVTDRLALRAKLGVSAWETTVSGLFSQRSTERFSGTDALLGVGAEWTWPSGFGVLVEHTDSNPGLAATQVGMSWRF